MKLYLFEHCSICFRVRMAAALKRLHLQETVRRLYPRMQQFRCVPGQSEQDRQGRRSRPCPEKSWIDDPAGISWETFFTTGESTDYGVSVEKDPRVAHGVRARQSAAAATSACCNT